jgi:hypothetical protein
MKLTLRAPIMRRCRSCARPHGATLLARIEPVERLSGVFLPSPCPGPRASRPAGRGHGGSGLRAQRRAFVCACVRRWAGRRRAQTRATLLFSPAVRKPLAPPPAAEPSHRGRTVASCTCAIAGVVVAVSRNACREESVCERGAGVGQATTSRRPRTSVREIEPSKRTLEAMIYIRSPKQGAPTPAGFNPNF